MEEVLKKIIVKIDALGDRMNNTDEKLDALGDRMNNVDEKLDALGDRMNAHDRSNKEEFRLLNKKIDAITDAVAKNMEDIYILKTQWK